MKKEFNNKFKERRPKKKLERKYKNEKEKIRRCFLTELLR
jgi:hypothetical protein